jgi:hypothetical protein
VAKGRHATLALIGGVLLHVPSANAETSGGTAVAVNKDAVAVIIGNKNYTGSVPEVGSTHNDAEAMKLSPNGMVSEPRQRALVIWDSPLFTSGRLKRAQRASRFLEGHSCVRPEHQGKSPF